MPYDINCICKKWLKCKLTYIILIIALISYKNIVSHYMIFLWHITLKKFCVHSSFCFLQSKHHSYKLWRHLQGGFANSLKKYHRRQRYDQLSWLYPGAALLEMKYLSIGIAKRLEASKISIKLNKLLLGKICDWLWFRVTHDHISKHILRITYKKCHRMY